MCLLIKDFSSTLQIETVKTQLSSIYKCLFLNQIDFLNYMNILSRNVSNIDYQHLILNNNEKKKDLTNDNHDNYCHSYLP